MHALTEYLQSASTAACNGVCLALDEQLAAADSAIDMFEAALPRQICSFNSCAASKDFDWLRSHTCSSEKSGIILMKLQARKGLLLSAKFCLSEANALQICTTILLSDCV